MNKLIKKYTITALFSSLLIGSFYPATQTLAQNQEPILIEIKDTDIGTEAFEKLKEFGIGGHATLGAVLGSGQNMTTNPGVGLGIGSGGNGYRPTVTIAVWTNKPFDAAAGLQAIKQHLNVSVNPVTTNGDCVIACDGTTQTVLEESKPSQTASETSTATQTETSTQTALPTAQPKSEPVVETTKPVVETKESVVQTVPETVATTTTTSTTEETVIVTTQIEKVTFEPEFVLKSVVQTIDVDAITAEQAAVVRGTLTPEQAQTLEERRGDYNVTPNS